MTETMVSPPTRVVIVGGGVVGSEVARRVGRFDRPVDVTLIETDGVQAYPSLLAEVASGVVEPSHAAVPLRSVLPRARVLGGVVTGRDATARTVRVRDSEGIEIDIPYDHLVVAPGSIADLAPIPGLEERAAGLRTITEALDLRERVLERTQFAEVTSDPARRARAATFVVVGAGRSGVQAIAAMSDLALEACDQRPGFAPDELRFVLVEATAQILPEAGTSMRHAAVRELESRRVEVRVETLVSSVDDQAIRLSDGTDLAADTVVWCAGSRPSIVLEALDLPLTEDGTVEVQATLEVRGHEGTWAAGDCAAVLDPATGRRLPRGEASAWREARTLAANIERTMGGDDPCEFRYRPKVELITIGRFSAVGEAAGVRLRGFPAWALQAVLHVSRVPTVARKARVVVDWLTSLSLPREVMSLGSDRDPHRPWRHAEGVSGVDGGGKEPGARQTPKEHRA